MAIYVNEGGPSVKHLHAFCPELLAEAHRGHPLKRVPNRSAANSTPRKRCEQCFFDGKALRDVDPPTWLDVVKLAQEEHPDRFWTYELSWPADRAMQVGMATRPFDRLSRRWRNTCRGRLEHSDSVPWLYDAIAAGRGGEVELQLFSHSERSDALEHEKWLRATHRDDGWHVSSDR